MPGSSFAETNETGRLFSEILKAGALFLSEYKNFLPIGLKTFQILGIEQEEGACLLAEKAQICLPGKHLIFHE